jgi:pimeloyl-ACP methyl ester carboxylesterase
VRTETARAPKLFEVPVGDLRFAVWDWPGAEPTLLFAHATSFHARCWDAIVREFPGQRCLAFDARGHGRSSKPAPPYHWRVFREDLLAILASLSVFGAIGIGHSMGGHTLAAVAAARPDAFRSLVLADPTIRGPEAYHTPPFDVSFVRKRRARWSSPEEMFESFRGRPPFASWKPDVLRDYCDFGLLPENGAFLLACPADVEASIYENSKEPETKLYGALASVRIPVVVLRAGYRGDLPFSQSPTDPRLASRFPLGQDVLLENHTHFIPMEAPELVAAYVRGQVEDLRH